jgi:PHYB activation tagged suppressor 1
MGYLIIAIAMVTFTIMMSKIWTICLIVFWRPYALTRHFRKQGVMGPRYSLLSGSLHDIKTMMIDARKSVMDKHSHDITQRVLPHYQLWSSLYGHYFSSICNSVFLSFFLTSFNSLFSYILLRFFIFGY